MSQTAPVGSSPSYTCHVFSAEDFVVVSGANLGDPLMPTDDLCAGDVYEFQPDGQPHELAIRDADAARAGNGRFLQQGATAQTVAEGSETGHLGDHIRLAGRLTFMRRDGDTVDILLIGLFHPDSDQGDLVFLPLAPIEANETYSLIDINEDPGNVDLTEITSVAFTRGTMITLGDGRQCPIEDLRPGDTILTRDNGPRPVRWIGQRTVRAVGPFAPVVISKDTMGNSSDLIVSQHQRIFVYQRGRDRLTGTAELLVKAASLVDGETVFVRPGGFVDYFHIVMDQHEIIYAECIPTESLLINESTLGHMPPEVMQEVSERFPDLKHRPHVGTEVDDKALQQLGPGRLFKASGKT